MATGHVPHLNFHGEARAALEFYARAFGGRADVRTYTDFGMPPELPGAAGVVFGQVVDAGDFTVMAYDVPGAPAPAAARPGATRREHGVTITDRPFFLALQRGTLDEAHAAWSALAEGAEVIEPLAASAWSAGFGMLADRFGVTWVISVVDEQRAQG